MSTIDTVYSSFIDSFSGNDSTTIFNTTFPVYQSTSTSHQLVVKTKVIATDVETTLVENTGYTVILSGNNPSTAVVTLTTPLPTGTDVFLIGDIQATQDINFNGSGTLDLDDIATAMNKSMLSIQQSLANQTELAVQVSATSGLSGLVLGTAVADGVWKWNTAKTEVEFMTIEELVSTSAFDISALTASTTLAGATDHLPFYDVSGGAQFKATLSDVVEAGLLGLTSISTEDQATIKTNLGIGSSGPDGTIKNIAYSNKTEAETVSNPTDWTDIANLSITITPSSELSTMILSTAISFETGTSTAVALRIVKDNQPINLPDKAATFLPGVAGDVAVNQLNGTSKFIMFSVVDTTGTTQPITYKVQVRTDDASHVYVNSELTTTDSDSITRSASQLNLIEVL